MPSIYLTDHEAEFLVKVMDEYADDNDNMPKDKYSILSCIYKKTRESIKVVDKKKPNPSRKGRPNVTPKIPVSQLLLLLQAHSPRKLEAVSGISERSIRRIARQHGVDISRVPNERIHKVRKASGNVPRGTNS